MIVCRSDQHVIYFLLLVLSNRIIVAKVRLDGELVGDPADVKMFGASGWVCLCSVLNCTVLITRLLLKYFNPSKFSRLL